MTAASKKTHVFGSLLFLFLFSVGFSLAGCGGKGGDSDPPSASGTFTPDSVNPGANTISLDGAVSGGDLYLTVKAGAVTDAIFGAAFDLVFNPDVLTYVECSAGDFFNGGEGITCAVAVRNDRLIVGVTAGQPGTGASGTGAVVTFHFRDKAAGSSSTAFENKALCSSASTASCDRQPLLPWYGGTYSSS